MRGIDDEHGTKFEDGFHRKTLHIFQSTWVGEGHPVFFEIAFAVRMFRPSTAAEGTRSDTPHVTAGEPR